MSWNNELTYSSVEGQFDRVLIVATGPSIKAVEPRNLRPAGVHVVAVNQALNLVAADSWITVDPSEKQRYLMARRHNYPRTTMYAAVPEDFGTKDARVWDHRKPPEPGVFFLRRLTNPSAPGRAVSRLSENRTTIHSGNSAWGGLGLAYHLRPATKPMRVGLLGVDGTTRYYIGDGRAGDLKHLPGLFASAVPQLASRNIAVMNGSPDSRITCFPRVTPDELLRWIAE